MTPARTRCYIDVTPGEGRSSYNTDVASLLIVFDTQVKLANTVGAIKDNDRSSRLEYAYQFKQTINKIEIENNSLQSYTLKIFILIYKMMLEDLQNTGVELNLVTKRIKYFLANIVYGVK